MLIPNRRNNVLLKLATKQPARNEPDDPGLWSRAISEAKKRFTVYPSAYANGWAAKWYKERGGGWHKEKQAASVAKKDVGHGGLDEWFSGHGKDKGRAQWGDWVSISPVRKTLKNGRVVEPGDIVGQCGISDSPDWRQYTKGGQDPLKCMPRKKAPAMSQEQRAALARGKARAERSSDNTGEPVMTRTFGKLAQSSSEGAADYQNHFDNQTKPLTARSLKRSTDWGSSPNFYPMRLVSDGTPKIRAQMGYEEQGPPYVQPDSPLSPTEQGPPMTWRQATTEFNRQMNNDNQDYAAKNWSAWKRKPGTINRQDPGDLNYSNVAAYQPRDVAGPPMTWKQATEEGYRADNQLSRQMIARDAEARAADAARPLNALRGRAHTERKANDRLGQMADWSNNLEKAVQAGFTSNVSPRDAAANRYGGYAAADKVFNTANQYGAGYDPKVFRAPVPIKNQRQEPFSRNLDNAAAYYSPLFRSIYLQEFGTNALGHELNHAMFPYRWRVSAAPARNQFGQSQGYSAEAAYTRGSLLGRAQQLGANLSNDRYSEKLVPSPPHDDEHRHFSGRGEMRAEHLRGLREWGAANDLIPTNPREAKELLDRFIYEKGIQPLRERGRNRAREEDFLNLQKNPNIGVEILQTVRAPTANRIRTA